MVNYYAFICTRSLEIGNVTEKLFQYFGHLNIPIKLLVGRKSIFEAYSSALKTVNPKDDDIVIMCHDDIEINTAPEFFKEIIAEELIGYKIGFLGVAGTTYLDKDAIWWDWDRQRRGLHCGEVYHLNNGIPYKTYYGPPDKVVVLDGVFLVATGATLRKIGLEKPDIFEGEWDFYDIWYTTKAHNSGFTNKVIPISITHHSSGQLVGRDSWHKNREAYIKNVSLPLELSENFN